MLNVSKEVLNIFVPISVFLFHFHVEYSIYVIILTHMQPAWKKGRVQVIFYILPAWFWTLPMPIEIYFWLQNFFSSVVELFAIEFKSLKLLWLGLIWRKKFCNSKRRKDLSHFRWTSPSFTLKEEGRELEMHGTTHIHRGEGAANIKSWTTPKKFFLSPFLFNTIWARSSMIFFLVFWGHYYFIYLHLRLISF